MTLDSNSHIVMQLAPYLDVIMISCDTIYYSGN